MADIKDYEKLTKAQLIEQLCLRDASPTDKDGVIASLSGKIEELEAELERKNEAIENMGKTISDQSAEMARMLEQINLSAKAGKTNGFGMFKCDGKNYQITAPKFNYDGLDYKAEELEKNTELQKALIAMKVGFIKEMEA